MSLQTKIAVAFIGMGVVPLLLVTWVSSAEGRRVLVGAHTRLLQEQATVIQTRLENHLERWRAETLAWTSLEGVRRAFETGDPKFALDPVEEQLRVQTGVVAVLVLDLEGVVVGMNSRDGEGRRLPAERVAGRSVKSAPWYPLHWNVPSEERAYFYVAPIPELEDVMSGDLRWLLVPAVIVDEFDDPIGRWITLVPVSRVGPLVFSEGTREQYAMIRGPVGESLATSAPPSDERGERVIVEGAVRGGEVVPGTGLWQEAALLHVAPNHRYPLVDAAGWTVVTVTSEAAAMAAARRFRNLVLLVAFVAMLVAVAVSFWWVRRLQRLAQSMVQFATGDLTVEVEATGDLAKAFRAVVENQRLLVSQIVDTASRIGSAADEVVATAHQQQSGAQEQASAAEQTRSAMVSLVSLAGDITRAAGEVVDQARSNRTHADHVISNIHQLTDQVERVGEILENIREIARKSEVLAVNAAIEGVKAKEAGRGFSLLARQMQSLAEGVKSWVRDIQVLTGTMRDATATSRSATEEAVSMAESNSRSAAEIETNARRQHSATEQVSIAMGDVARVAVESLGAHERLIQMSGELGKAAEELRGLVGQFRLEAPAQNGGPGRPEGADAEEAEP